MSELCVCAACMRVVVESDQWLSTVRVRQHGDFVIDRAARRQFSMRFRPDL